MSAKRTAFTLEEKVALRKHHRQWPLSSQKALCEWFEESFNKPIRQATVSEVLSSRYSHLDDVLTNPALSSKKKQRIEAYPELESALNTWFFHAQSSKDLVINGDVVRAKARFFWHDLPQYQGLEEPSFSNGWLHRFKQRHGIKEWRRFGELASVDKEGMAADLVSEVRL